MSFIELASGMIDKLPQILSMLQTVSLLVMAWFLGSIAVKSFKRHMQFGLRYILSLGIGFLIIFCASALNNVLIFVSGGIYDLINANFLINGIISTIIVSVGLYLASKDTRQKSATEIIKELEGRVACMRNALAEHKVYLVSDADAKNKARELVKNYEVKDVTLREGKWTVNMHDAKDNKAIVFIDPYDGTYEIAKSESFIKQRPFLIIGMAVIVCLVIFSFLNFSGFPENDFSSGISEITGMPKKTFDGLLNERNITDGCVSAITMMAEYGNKMNELSVFEDNATKSLVEERTSQSVVIMYKVNHEGTDYIMALALSNDFDLASADQSEIAAKTNVCIVKGDKICDCLR